MLLYPCRIVVLLVEFVSKVCCFLNPTLNAHKSDLKELVFSVKFSGSGTVPHATAWLSPAPLCLTFTFFHEEQEREEQSFYCLQIEKPQKVSLILARARLCYTS